MDVKCECPFRKNKEETINHIFIDCDEASNFWCTIKCYSSTLTNMNLQTIDSMEYIWTQDLV